MKIFNFSGHGSFSNSFGWDNGLSSHVEGEITWEDALETNQSAVDYSNDFNSWCLPNSPEPGVYVFYSNEYGGSREVRGFVIAESEEQANEMLCEYDSSYEIVEYEE